MDVEMVCEKDPVVVQSVMQNILVPGMANAVQGALPWDPTSLAW